MRSLVLVLAMLSTPLTHAADPPPPTAETTTPEISDKLLVTRLSEDALILKFVDHETNIGLLKTAEGVVLIDPMPGSENLDALDKAVKDLAGEPAKFILNTHEHSDHTGGNAYLVEKGSTLLDGAADLTEIHESTAMSHTSEDRILFHEKSNSIFVGDIYDTRWHPTFYAGGLSGFGSAIEEILMLGNDGSIIVPGRGKPTSKVELRAFRENTLAWASRIRELKADGMTAAEIINDVQAKAILEKFNLENKQDFIPGKARVRFIERTLSVIEKEM